MNEQQVLLGSLSQDLFRIANFIQTGSEKSAQRFWQEAIRWVEDLKKNKKPAYLDRVLDRISEIELNPSSIEQGEEILTYGVITQSLAIHGFDHKK